MRRFRRFLSVALLAMTHLPLQSGEPQGPLDFLYIEANVGSSSGGHVALRVGDDVFHYQHDRDALVTLARDDWASFRHAYNDRENRNIHVARIRVDSEAMERIRDRFLDAYLVQGRDLAFLASLKDDVRLLENMVDGVPPSIRGAEWFTADPAAGPEFATLRVRVAEQVQPAFLARRLHQVRPDLEGFESPFPLPQIDRIRHTAYPRTLAERYQDFAARLIAYQVLSGRTGLSGNALLDPDSGNRGVPRMRLSPRERTRMEELASRFEHSVVSLLNTERSDHGYPLLLAITRWAAARRSLDLDRLVLANAYTVPPGRRADLTAAQLSLRHTTARRAYDRTRRYYFALDELDEASLAELERSAARYLTVVGTDATDPVSDAVAAARIPAAEVLLEGIGPQRVEGLQRAAHLRLREFSERLRKAYGYHLISRNCATELVRTLNSAFVSESDAVAALGGRIRETDPLVFIPFGLHDSVVRAVRIDRHFTLPSFRRRVLEDFSRRESAFWIYLPEATTLTSALYLPHKGDTPFLFFTEDLLVLRPVFGGVNLLYGLANAGGGVVMAPWDGGEQFVEGLRGALFSLPELAFFNIRKGSFEPDRLSAIRVSAEP